jgi:hypothetical protein
MSASDACVDVNCDPGVHADARVHDACSTSRISRAARDVVGLAAHLLSRIIRLEFATDVVGMVALLKMPRPYRGPVRIDRRTFPRKEVHAELEVARIDNTLDALKTPKVTLYLRDLSLGGMSAISPLPLQQGERLALHFPRTETYGGWDAVGHVRRCVQSALGYRVAVEFDPLPAA